MMEHNTILMIEDDAAIREGVRILLEGDGFVVDEAENGRSGIRKLTDQTQLVILDIMMPGISGIRTCEEIRRQSKVPVLFLTAKGQESDKLLGLTVGGDDYLVKPFDVLELLARVEVVLRRYHKTESTLSAGDVTVDLEARKVTRGGREIILTNKEYGLLVLFIQNKNVALFKERLYEKVWGDEYIADSRTLELHVQRLRRKMGWEKNLVAVYKVGYRLEI